MSGRFSVGWISSGPPQPPLPALILTFLYLPGIGEPPGGSQSFTGRHRDGAAIPRGLRGVGPAGPAATGPAERQADRDEVAADLRVDREERGERVLGRDLAGAELRAEQGADDLCDD